MERRLLIAFICFGLGIVMLVLFFILKKRANPKIVFIHLIIGLLVFGGLGALGLMAMAQPQRIYLALQLIFLFLGGMHTWLLYHLHTWSEKEKILGETLFTLAVTLLGGATFLLVFHLLHQQGYNGPLAGSLLAFPIPFFAHKAFIYLGNIPSPVYKTWHYSDHLALPEIKAGDAIKVRFRITRNIHDSQYAKFTIRAPLIMDFGSLFLSFLLDYNQKNPQSEIQPNTQEAPFCWFFYIKKGWWNKQIIDPDLTVKANHLRNDTTIDAERIFIKDLNY